jgi:hypothetical protein
MQNRIKRFKIFTKIDIRKRYYNVIVLAECQAVSTGRQGKPLGQNVYGTGRTIRWK